MLDLENLPYYLNGGDDCEAAGYLGTDNTLNNCHFIFDVYHIELNPNYVVLTSEHDTLEQTVPQLSICIFWFYFLDFAF